MTVKHTFRAFSRKGYYAFEVGVYYSRYFFVCHIGKHSVFSYSRIGDGKVDAAVCRNNVVGHSLDFLRARNVRFKAYRHTARGIDFVAYFLSVFLRVIVVDDYQIAFLSQFLSRSCAYSARRPRYYCDFAFKLHFILE